jgi:hypothetical protein
VPGRAGRQFVALQQNNIGPAEFGKMIQDGAADEAAADYHGLGMGAHEKMPFTEEGWIAELRLRRGALSPGDQSSGACSLVFFVMMPPRLPISMLP